MRRIVGALVALLVSVIALTASPVRAATPSVNTPTGVTATVAGNGALSASWNGASVRSGPPVNAYTAYTVPGGQSCVTTSTSCVIRGLTNGTRYTVTVVATNGVEQSFPSSPSAAVTVGLARYVGAAAGRLLDTRAGTRLSAGSTTLLPVAVRVGLAANEISAAIVNITATQPAGAGYVSAYPSKTPTPTVSNVNVVRAGQTVSNLATVPVGADGAIALTTSVATHLVIDLIGVYVPATNPANGEGRFVGVAPARLLDTRIALGVTTRRPYAAGSTVTFTATGRGGIPTTGVRAVVVNLTIADPAGAGYATAYPSGTARPNVSSVNIERAGQTIANSVIVPLVDGKVAVYVSMQANVIADVTGYFTAGSASDVRGSSGYYVPINPVRVHDTRNFTKPSAGRTIAVPVLGAPGVPTSSVSAVVANITGVDPTADGYVTAFPGGTLPTVSSLNLSRNVPIMPSHVMVGVGTGGSFRIYSQSGAHLVVDVFGWITA
ncbi:MAG: fibronectin type III domain-containing protein [Acidimicrobiia bacterium]